MKQFTYYSLFYVQFIYFDIFTLYFQCKHL